MDKNQTGELGRGGEVRHHCQGGEDQLLQSPRGEGCTERTAARLRVVAGLAPRGSSAVVAGTAGIDVPPLALPPPGCPGLPEEGASAVLGGE